MVFMVGEYGFESETQVLNIKMHIISLQNLVVSFYKVFIKITKLESSQHTNRMCEWPDLYTHHQWCKPRNYTHFGHHRTGTSMPE